MSKKLFTFFLTFVLFTSFILAEEPRYSKNYGDGNYGVDDYGMGSQYRQPGGGGTPSTPTPTPSSESPISSTDSSSSGGGGISVPRQYTPPSEEVVSEVKSIDQSTSVSGEFTESSVVFTLSYSGSSQGFYGDLEFRLPFEYSDYQNGLIVIDPEPTRVLPGSVIAVYESVEVAPSRVFNVKINVAKPLDVSILEQFTAPKVVRKTVAPGKKPTPSFVGVSEPKPLAKASVETPTYNLLLMVVGILVIAAGAYFFVYKKKYNRL